MTPLRVRLAGFLSYREAQEIHLTQGVWLLAGSNGSGKSAIFDGVTYALFGVHRGGSQNAVELVNKESASASIEFDFSIGEDHFRIKRTLKKTKTGTTTGTQQLFAASGTIWNPIPDTTKKIDFDKWIHQKIGLTYETFTSSVLLLQNKAEKLLDAKPAGRAEVLAGIVDLEKYRALHKRADTKRLILKSQAEQLAFEVSAVPLVSEEQYAEASIRVSEAHAAKDRATTTIEGLLAQEGLARQWVSAQTRLAVTREKLRRAEQTLAEAVSIESAYSRLQELTSALPTVELIVVEKHKIVDAERKLERLNKERDEAKKKKEHSEHSANEARAKRDRLRELLQADDVKLNATKDECTRLTALMEQVKFAEELQSEIQRLADELKEYPTEIASKALSTAERVEKLLELSRLLPAAERILVERTARDAALKKETDAKAQADRVKAEGEKARAEVDRLNTLARKSQEQLSQAEKAHAAAMARAEDAKKALAEFDEVAHEPQCRSCGQPLTPAHRDAERAKRIRELDAAESTVNKATQTKQKCLESDHVVQQETTQATETLERLRSEYRDWINESHAANTEAERLGKSITALERELPETLRSEASVNAAREQIAELESARREAATAKRDAEKAKLLQTQIDSKRQSHQRILAKLPSGDHQAIRDKVTEKLAEQAVLVSQVKSGKTAAEDADRKMDVFGRDAHDAAIRLTELSGKLIQEEQARQFSLDAIRRAMNSLTVSWRAEVEHAGMQKHYEWKQERDDLIAAQTQERFQQLAASRGGLESIRLDVAAAERDLEQYPPTARRDPDEIKREIAAARRSANDRDAEVAAAEKAKADLERDRLRRAEVEGRQKETDLIYNRYKLLTELLGRDRLQRHLVRTAERQIVDQANAVLDRLSAGTLFLRLVAGDDSDDRVLDLECWNRQTGDSPIPVAFLSGGQRFRVAISLALGIGQFTGKQHRPVESVIIDEGFGSLDRTGRQSVIQELHNLRGLLKCVVLVSHQEEFADAFPNGYHFEIKDGATVVRPLHEKE
ncbi:MAG: SMC family ATPase [Gemmataceae bacterium]